MKSDSIYAEILFLLRKSKLIGIVLVGCSLFLGATLIQAGPPDNVHFEWTMADRFGHDGDGDGIIDALDTPALVNPEVFSVTFDACSISIANDWKTYPLSYRWWIDGREQIRSPLCESTLSLNEGNHSVRLVLTNAVGSTVSSEEQNVRVQDWLIVSIGDSFASGEGNPDIPAPDFSDISDDVLEQLSVCGVDTFNAAATYFEELGASIETVRTDLEGRLNDELILARNDLDTLLNDLEILYERYDSWLTSCYPTNFMEIDVSVCIVATQTLIAELGRHIDNPAELLEQEVEQIAETIMSLPQNARDTVIDAQDAILTAEQTIQDAWHEFDTLKGCINGVIADPFGASDDPQIGGLGSRWVEWQCHRSMKSKEAIAALELERSDPKTSVTFVSTACGGGTIKNGLLNEFSGGSHPRAAKFAECEESYGHQYCCDTIGGCKEPQLTAVEKLVGNREIDSLLISVGGNDIGFADIISGCIFSDNCNDNIAYYDRAINSELLNFCESFDDPAYGDAGKWLVELCRFDINDRLMTVIPIPSEDDHVPVEGASSLFNKKIEDLSGSSGWYEQLNQAIKNTLSVPSNHIYITEYPAMTRNENNEYCISHDYSLEEMLPGFRDSEISWADTGASVVLNQKVADTGMAHGWQIIKGIYDEYNDFDDEGHGYCSSSRWIRRLQESLKEQGDIQGTMHPTFEGNQHIASSILASRLQGDLYVNGEPRPLTGKPVASILGNYTMNEGDAMLPVHQSYDEVYPQQSLSCYWSEGMGSKREGMLSPDNPEFWRPVLTALDDGEALLKVRVSNPTGASDVASSTVTINNVSPEVSLSPTVKGKYYTGSQYVFQVKFSDPGVKDTHTVSVDWGDGTASVIMDAVSPLNFEHMYAVSDTFTIRVSVTDDDGGVGDAGLDLTVNQHPFRIDDDGDGYSEQDGDCDDNNRWDVHPDADEICDHIDNNCDGQVDEVGCGVIYVNTSAFGANNGISWSDAYTDLQSALDEAVSGQQIWVAKGTYTPGTNRNDSFSIGRGVELYGGFGGDESRISKRNFTLNQTILSGDIGTINDNGDNSYHVVKSVGPEGLPFRLDGFIVANGNATGDSNPDGGGLVTPHGNTIVNCIFLNNHGRNGGAVDADRGAMGGGASFINCRFLGNTGDELGGALYLYENIINFTNCVFSGNIAGLRGGAIAAEEYSRFNLSFSTLSHNEAAHYGGAIYLFNSAAVDVTQNIAIMGSILWNNEVSAEEKRGNEIAVRGHYFEVSIDYSAISYDGMGYLPNSFHDQYSSSIAFGTHNQNQQYPIDFVNQDGADFTAGTQDDDLRLAFDMDGYGSGGIDSVNLSLLPVDYADLDNDGDTSEPLPLDLDHRTRTHGIVDMGAYENNSLTWYVNNSATGIRDGRSWNDAFVHLQDALSISLPYDIIQVAEGTYKPDLGTGMIEGSRVATFSMKDNLIVRGGYSGDGDERNPEEFITVLNGDIGVEGDTSDNSYHVVTADRVNHEAGLNGFTISGGNANAAHHPDNKGGGVLFITSDMGLTDCVIQNNFAGHRGGGIWIGEKSPSIKRNVINNNTAPEGGGMAMENADLPIVSHCIFTGNNASDDGGALNSAGTENGLFRNNVFSGNIAADKGGAIVSRGADNLTFENCSISENSGVYGGGLFVSSESGVTVSNSILWNNSANNGPQIAVRDSSLSASWTVIESGTASFYLENATAVNTTDIYLFDPLFIDAAGADKQPGTLDDDIHLATLSQAIDAGDPAKLYSYEPVDHGGRLNLGAYGNTSEAAVSRTSGGITLYVSGSASGKNTGTSWEDAMVSLQNALGTAKSGDQIWVAEGIYRPDEQQFAKGDRNASFQLKSGVALYGGFHQGDSWTDRDSKQKITVLSGDLNGDDQNDFSNYDENSQHVVIGSGTDHSAIIDGFTIRGGHATDAAPYPANGGAGMYNENGSPTISNCVFEYNLADARGGGGILNHENSHPEIAFSVFRYNRGGNGGALYNAYNSISHIHHTLFDNNNGNHGGAVELVSSADVLIENCTFINNRATVRAGALRVYASSPVIKNTIFWNNSAPVGQGSQIGLNSGAVSISYSDLAEGQGGIYTDNSSVIWGAGNLENVSPLFTDNTASLYAHSACIDSGDPTSDYSEEPTPDGGRINMGIWGGTANATKTIIDNDGDGILNDVEVTSCTGQDDADSDDDAVPDGAEDVNHNGIVDPGETDPCNNDTDGDGIQDGVELGYTLQNLGPYTNPNYFQSDIDPGAITDPLLVDTDGDGFSDYTELLDGTNPLDRNSVSLVYRKTKVAKTGQQTCYDNNGTEIPCVGTALDGDLQSGAALPAPRFIDLEDGTVKDNLTGLTWLKNADCFGGPNWNDGKNWQDSVAAANTLNDGECGLADGSLEGDWRLPNIRELQSLVNLEYANPSISNATGTGHWQENDPFTDLFVDGHYWSSTAFASGGPFPNQAWSLSIGRGTVSTADYSWVRKVWPVKGNPSDDSVILLPRTGQTDSFLPGDDGAIQAGVPFPEIRFTDNTDGTVTDNLTGLIWLQNAYCSGVYVNLPTTMDYLSNLNSYGTMNGQDCGDLSNNGSHQTDWRFPTVNELWSLIDFSIPYVYGDHSALPSPHPFLNLRTSYWTATTISEQILSTQQFTVDLTNGVYAISRANKTGDGAYKSFLPVRGGTLGTSRTLTLTPSGTGSGTVTSDPIGISCGSDCSHPYSSGTIVNLTYVANTGSTFSGWSGDVGCSDGSVTMDSSKNCIAEFSLKQHTITTQVSQVDGGTLSCTPNPVDHGNASTCIVTTNADYTLQNVTGSCDGTLTGSTFITNAINADCTLTANFISNLQYNLDIILSGTGSGTVTSIDGGIDCGTDCSERYTADTSVSLMAAADSGSIFTGWDGDSACTTGNVIMDTAHSCTAVFSLEQYDITTSATPIEGGSISCSPDPVTHGNTTVCTATSNTGYTLWDVGGGCGGSLAGNSYSTHQITTDCSVDATFAKDKYRLTVTLAGEGFGTVSSTPGGIDCGQDCFKLFDYNTEVTLTATPDNASFFLGWSGDGDCSSGVVTMHNVHTCVATFRSHGDGLQAVYSNGIKRLEGPIYHGHSHDCSTTDNNMYEGVCVPFVESPVDWAWDPSFSVKWTGFLYAPVSGTYTIASHYWVDGTVRVEVDGVKIADFNTIGGGYSGEITMTAGSWLPISASFSANGGSNGMVIGWKLPGKDWTLIPREYLKSDIRKKIPWPMFLPAITGKKEL